MSEVKPWPSDQDFKRIEEELREHSIDRIAEEIELRTSGCAGAPVPIRTDDLRWMVWATRILGELVARRTPARPSELSGAVRSILDFAKLQAAQEGSYNGAENIVDYIEENYPDASPPPAPQEAKPCDECADSMDQCGLPNRVPDCCWDDSSTTKPCPKCQPADSEEPNGK